MLRSLEISSSKSLMNRALILQSYFPELKIQAYSDCEDVVHLKESLARMQSQRELFVGEGGTTLRFLALKVSRLPGTWILKGKESLFRRPQKGLVSLMNQFGVDSQWHQDHVQIHSEGWKISGEEIQIDVADSSQFATSLLLNCWNLKKDLNFSIQKEASSESYFNLTLKLCTDLGLKVNESFRPEQGLRAFHVPSGQKPNVNFLEVEIDVSSAFTMSCFAALHQDTEIKNFPFKGDQPDLEFLNIFKQMGILYQQEGNSLYLRKAKDLRGVDVNVKNSPDLFPVLAVLCSQAHGPSRIYGAAQLVHKESDRLAKTKELLDLCSIRNTLLKDGLEISGPNEVRKNKDLIFNPAADHRMAMAAALLKSVGYHITIMNPQVVDKSFPEFWRMIGMQS